MPNIISMQRESHELEEFEAFEARLPVLIVAQITGRVLRSTVSLSQTKTVLGG